MYIRILPYWLLFMTVSNNVGQAMCFSTPGQRNQHLQGEIPLVLTPFYAVHVHVHVHVHVCLCMIIIFTCMAHVHMSAGHGIMQCCTQLLLYMHIIISYQYKIIQVH